MNAIVCKAKNVRLTHRLAMLTLFLCVFSGAKAQVTITTDPTNPAIYLIQSYCNEAFYMRDNNRNNNPSKVNTSNIVTEYSEWYFLDGGTFDGVQYYYIVHKKTGKYVYLSSEAQDTEPLLKDAPTAGQEDYYRFKFVLNSSRSAYNILVKLNNNTRSLNKKNGNSQLDNIRQYSVDDDNSCWNFVAKANYTKTTPPFELSTEDGEIFYYNIQNNRELDLYMNPGTTYVVSDRTFADENDRVWYFVKANIADDYLDYYYIRHPKTNKYLRYRGTNNDSYSNAVELKNYAQNEQNRFLYIIVPGSRDGEDHASTTSSSTYCIAPKLPMVVRVENTVSLCTSSDNTGNANVGKPLRAFKERNNNNHTHWNFIPTTYEFACQPPVIEYNEATNTVSISAQEGATIYYTTDGSNPTVPASGTTQTSSTNSVSFQPGNNVSVIKAVAAIQPSGTDVSEQAIRFIRYLTVHSSDEITNMYNAYSLAEDFTSSASIGTQSAPFEGCINGNLVVLSGLDHSLVAYADGAVIKNVILDNVSISGTNVGAICNEATGASRIYNCGVLATGSTANTDENGYTFLTNCSSTISGSGYVGGIVGLLDGESRVINCFSYANITGGDLVGGIVGKNNVVTTSSNLKTMVMNCMFYGDITGGNSKAPIYNGEIITNRGDQSGVSNFNYFWSGASYVQNKHINKYNCALAAETRFLQRFEFFRQLLNSHRELAAWWVTGDRRNKDEMMKWVMEPSQIGTSTPYPILKTPGKYPSVVNYDTINVGAKPRNQGGKLGVLTVNIQMGSGGAQFAPPTGATISTSSLKLPIIDKDTAHFNFNYYKVQLPYYNDVGSKNYNDNRVVTGWKIVSITGGTPGTYSEGSDVTFSGGEIDKTPYNFADRHCTNKDLYGTNGSYRVFSQGAYWDVPEGVTAITIQPYWAKAAYVADANADVVYNKDMDTKSDVPYVGGGTIYSNNTNYDIAGSSQKVYTSISNALGSTALNPNAEHTVNDYAIVLVGNYHQKDGINTDKPYTVTSIDLDHDNEPDYTFMLRFDGRTKFHAVKYDFVSLVGLGMAQKSTEGKGSYNFGIPQPLDWFELTNTSLFRVTQFEYDYNYSGTARAEAPYILQGGVIEQWVSGQTNGVSNNTKYFHVGGNVWFKEFHLGCHQDVLLVSKHPPISVTGGDFDAFYLTGLYSNAGNYNDDAECYINGGRFGTMAGTGMEGIGDASTPANGNITWIIDNADIKEFFAGGINAAKIAEGNLYTRISNSHVGHFYGGPKFGDMNDGRTVKTKADNCTFGFFFGAGYAGNSYYTAAPGNFTNDNDPWYSSDEKPYNLDWDRWVKGEIKPTLNHGNYSNNIAYNGYDLDYIAAFGGVSTAIDYQFLPHSNNQKNVGRLFLKFVKFSLATTRSVTSTLTGCTINNSFYGGGSLGKVEGDVESTLDGCTVRGDVFGAGYSATIPTVPVMDRGGFKAHEEGQAYPYYQPYYDKNLGVYLPGKFPNTVDYRWEYDPEHHPVTSTETAVDPDNHILYTTVNLNKRELGSVKGNVTLTIKGNSTVFGSVFGGGEESLVVRPENTDKGNTEVRIFEQTKVLGNIYGGGNMGEVEGNTKVIVNSGNDSGGSGGGGN